MNDIVNNRDLLLVELKYIFALLQPDNLEKIIDEDAPYVENYVCSDPKYGTGKQGLIKLLSAFKRSCATDICIFEGKLKGEINFESTNKVLDSINLLLCAIQLKKSSVKNRVLHLKNLSRATSNSLFLFLNNFDIRSPYNKVIESNTSNSIRTIQLDTLLVTAINFKPINKDKFPNLKNCTIFCDPNFTKLPKPKSSRKKRPIPDCVTNIIKDNKRFINIKFHSKKFNPEIEFNFASSSNSRGFKEELAYNAKMAIQEKWPYHIHQQQLQMQHQPMLMMQQQQQKRRRRSKQHHHQQHQSMSVHGSGGKRASAPDFSQMIERQREEEYRRECHHLNGNPYFDGDDPLGNPKDYSQRPVDYEHVYGSGGRKNNGFYGDENYQQTVIFGGYTTSSSSSSDASFGSGSDTDSSNNSSPGSPGDKEDPDDPWSLAFVEKEKQKTEELKKKYRKKAKV